MRQPPKGNPRIFFQLGDKVRWTSSAQGFQKEKRGEVVQVVPPKNFPDRERFLDLYKGPGVGGYRDHESYVVRVGKKHYWPRIKHLELDA